MFSLQHWMMMSLLLLGTTMVPTLTDDGSMEQEGGTSFYSFPVMDITGNIISLEEYAGKVSLVVNVASQCGYTDGHYKMLTLLQKLFDETNKFNVLGFPCNQFGNQEPGTAHEILDFAYNRMGANFPLFAKVNVMDHNINAAWNHLIQESGVSPTWNFYKYLVDHNGHVIKAWGPSISPDQLYPNIQSAIDKAVAADAERNKNDAKGSKENGHTARDEF